MNTIYANDNNSLFENLDSRNNSVPIHLKKWLRIEEVIKLYPLTKSQCQKYKRYGIPAYVIGRKLIFKKDEIEQWLEEQSA